MLKTAWMRAYQVKGEASDVRQKWRQFKTRVCQKEVDDEHMTREQYHHLLNALEQQKQKEGQGRSRVTTGKAE